ncbi:hypothetical protein T552_02008 [Pneumocystis carinii B80]|uniref:Uncharacterized protein n=1 Tax=Pneumocystis carinii (strain B80) TaxID=1408658 RepID=A0A0W4ZIF9_PNEC8|nr:hypothetical protein T552_02008 [Pneumocystis carinii B80]KTW28149.1 hypothetical protein T552_02008 [Pneumocystis carinii B80]
MYIFSSSIFSSRDTHFLQLDETSTSKKNQNYQERRRRRNMLLASLGGALSDFGAYLLRFQSKDTEWFWKRTTRFFLGRRAFIYTAGAFFVFLSLGSTFYLYRGMSKDDTVGSDKKQVGYKKKPKNRKKRKVRITENESSVKDETQGLEILDEELFVTQEKIEQFSESELKAHSIKLKNEGNKAYSRKEYDKAIEFYTHAISCSKDPVFYSNRAACYIALNKPEQVIEDTTTALSLDSTYVKALNRRATAYEMLNKNDEALLDYTTSCIMDGFSNENAAQSVERLLKKIAEEKAKAIMKTKKKQLPSPTFITAYLDAFRPRPIPKIETNDETSGDYHLKQGFKALLAKNYDTASQSFSKAIELECSSSLKSLAYNMSGTFKFIQGSTLEALEDFNKAIEFDPTDTQNYIKRASVHMELGDRFATWSDFDTAQSVNPKDPDIYYHRGQMHFITGEFSEAAKDYQKSIDLDKEFIFSHIQYGVVQYKLGNTALSMSIFRKCLKMFQKSSDVYNYYGELLLDQQRFQDAIEKFDIAIQLEKSSKFTIMNVLPLINKALAVFQWKKDIVEAEKLCKKALAIDPGCDVAVATIAQLLLQQGKIEDAIEYFNKSAQLARTESELVNALSYCEATKIQLQVTRKYPHLAERLNNITKGNFSV